jgi:hypothetical protein
VPQVFLHYLSLIMWPLSECVEGTSRQTSPNRPYEVSHLGDRAPFPIISVTCMFASHLGLSQVWCTGELIPARVLRSSLSNGLSVLSHMHRSGRHCSCTLHARFACEPLAWGCASPSSFPCHHTCDVAHPSSRSFILITRCSACR